MGIYIPNIEKPKNCNECPIRIGETVSMYYDSRSDEFKRIKITGCNESKYHTKTLGEGYEMMYKDCPLIEIDESEMEYLYKEFGLEKDENLTERAKELKRAILMGYLYAESNTDQDVEQEEWIDWREGQEYEDRWNTMERKADEL